MGGYCGGLMVSFVDRMSLTLLCKEHTIPSVHANVSASMVLLQCGSVAPGTDSSSGKSG